MAKIRDAKDALMSKGSLKPAVNTFGSLLTSSSIKKRFDEVLGKKSAAFLSSLLTIYNSNGYLKNADPMSVISSAMIAATLDLPINQNLGFAHIVPYGNKAQFQMGWKGFVQLAERTGLYKTMNVAEVYDGELIENNRFTGEMKFDSEQKKSDEIIGYVAYFRLMNGFEKYLYMTKKQAEAHGKKYSKSYNTGNWQNNFDAMALKTVIKMLLSKFGILSIEMQKAVEADQATINEDGTPEYVDNPKLVDAEISINTEKTDEGGEKNELK